MTKTWIADCTAFKKHPDGEITHRLVVKAKYKKDAIDYAKKELALFDEDHHDKYRVPALREVTNEEEAEAAMVEYLAKREKLAQTDLADNEDNYTPAGEPVAITTEDYKNAVVSVIDRYGIAEDWTPEMIQEAQDKLEGVSNEFVEYRDSDAAETLKNFVGCNWKAVFPINTANELSKTLLNIRTMRVQLGKLIVLRGEKAQFAPQLDKPAPQTLQEATSELTAEMATMAEYAIIEPYAVRLAIAKNGESFIHSMAVINRETNGNLVGQIDVFNPRPFSTIESAVVYGLAMAIDAVNAHLNSFLQPKQLETCVKILSGYAQDAEGNFIERYVSDYDMANASLMAVSKPQNKPSAMTEDIAAIVNAIANHPSVKSSFSGSAAEIMAKRFEDNFTNLRNKYGELPAAQIVEHINGLTTATSLQMIENCDELVSHYVKNTTTETVKELTTQPEPEPEPTAANPKDTCHIGRSILKSIANAGGGVEAITTDQLKMMVENMRAVFSDLAKEHGTNFLQGHTIAKMENEQWSDVDAALMWFLPKEMLSAITRRAWLTLENPEETLKDLPEEPHQNGQIEFYAAPQMVHYIEEIMAQFSKPENGLPKDMIEKAAHIVGKVFNDWRITLFVEKDQYTIDADMFKDEIYLEFNDDKAHDALETLCSYISVESKLVDVLSCSYDDYVNELDPKAKEGLTNLVQRLVTDSSLGCTHTAQKIKALLYSELQANPVPDKTLTTPALTMGWWNQLNADYCANKRRTPQLYTMAMGTTDELREHADRLGQALAVRTQEVINQSKEFEKDACVSGDGTAEPIKTTLPSSIDAPEITPDEMEADLPTYGDRLLSGDIDAPYQCAIAIMLRYHGAENYYSPEWYLGMGNNLNNAVKSLLIDFPNLEPGATVENFIKNYSWSCLEDMEAALNNAEILDTLLYEHAIFKENQPEEATQDAQEATRQDFKPYDDDSITSAPNRAPDAVETQEMTLRAMFQQQMRIANERIGLVGAAWGYEIKRHWTENKKDNRVDCHCEIGLWLRDKNGMKNEALSFFGVSNANVGNYINDAMMLALVDGLSVIFAALGLEVEG